ncbi:YdcY family protein [Citrobacter amalonaticus]
MSHLDEVSTRVDAAIDEGVITHMNELLIALSDDAQLSRDDRYTQQQRLRTAIAHHGRQHKEDMEARREQLTKGGTIL